MCVLDFGKGWDRYLALIEFTYNNSYQASIQMAPYDALFGRKHRTPLNWNEIGERKLIGPQLVLETEEKVRMIRERLIAAQSQQKSYADRRRRALNLKWEIKSL